MQPLLHRLKTKSAFVSLPIILLLLFVIGLVYGFHHKLAYDRQWRYQQQLTLENQAIWSEFAIQIATQPDKIMALGQADLSHCEGFCSLDKLTQLDWPYRYQSTKYQVAAQSAWQVLHWQLTKMAAAMPYYRLCAKQPQSQQIRCWWYQELGKQIQLVGYIPLTLP